MRTLPTASLLAPLAVLLCLAGCDEQKVQSHWPISYELAEMRHLISLDAALVGKTPSACAIVKLDSDSQSRSLFLFRSTAGLPARDDWHQIEIEAAGDYSLRYCKLTSLDNKPVVIFSGWNTALNLAIPAETPVTKSTDWRVREVGNIPGESSPDTRAAWNIRVSGDHVYYLNPGSNQPANVNNFKLETSSDGLALR